MATIPDKEPKRKGRIFFRESVVIMDSGIRLGRIVLGVILILGVILNLFQDPDPETSSG